MALFVLSKQLMFSRMLFSLVLAAAVFVAPLRAPAPACILSNTASEQSCQPASCNNPTCCATTAEHRSAPTIPVAKSDSGQNLIAACVPALFEIAACEVSAAKPFIRPAVSSRASAQPGLALLCTFLI